MELTTQLSENKIVLLILSREKYNLELNQILKVLHGSARKTCYVCINEPYSYVCESLKKNDLSQQKFFFIDTVTKKVQTPPAADDCIFVSAPNALTEISLAFSKAFAERQCDAVLFDSLSMLMIYENSHSIVQFVHSLLTKLRISGGRAYFVALKDDISTELVKDLHMFVDKVVDIGN